MSNNWGWPQWVSAAYLLLALCASFSDDIVAKRIAKPRTVSEYQAELASSIFFILWLSYAGGFWK